MCIIEIYFRLIVSLRLRLLKIIIRFTEFIFPLRTARHLFVQINNKCVYHVQVSSSLGIPSRRHRNKRSDQLAASIADHDRDDDDLTAYSTLLRDVCIYSWVHRGNKNRRPHISAEMCKPENAHKFYDKWLTIGFHEAKMKLDEQIDGELNGKAANMKCFMFTKRWRQDSVTKYIKRKSIFFVCFFTDYYIYDYLRSAFPSYPQCATPWCWGICHAKRETRQTTDRLKIPFDAIWHLHIKQVPKHFIVRIMQIYFYCSARRLCRIRFHFISFYMVAFPPHTNTHTKAEPKHSYSKFKSS